MLTRDWENGLCIWLVVVGDEIVYANDAHSDCHSPSVPFDRKMTYVFSKPLLRNPTFSLALTVLIIRSMRSLVAEEMMDRCRETLAGRTHFR